ncbi:MAG: hypothetical protein A4S16_01520 [Proteobacteria bacterium SG_bin6]|nr:MAG: hypothetical protein A4S16_01520 [Proteobacteria bacterium SG_bin6]
MRTLFPAIILIGFFACLSACDRQSQPAGKAPVAKTDESAINDPEMAKKLAEAKAAYAKLTPAEKAKLAARWEKERTTLPISLTEARSIKIRPVGAAETTLGARAPVGTPTVVAAWASWCIPCKLEARELARLRQQYGRDKLNIVYLNIGTPDEERAKGLGFLRDAGAQQLGLTMLDQADYMKLTRVDQVSVPRVLVFDRTGKPISVISGAVTGKRDMRLANAINTVVS